MDHLRLQGEGWAKWEPDKAAGFCHTAPWEGGRSIT